MRKALSLLICLGATVSIVAGFQNAQSTPVAVKVSAALSRHFGPTLEAATERQPYFFVADFNGDGFKDVLVLIRWNSSKDKLPKNVTQLNPWGYENNDSPGTSNLALAVIHGCSRGWDVPQPGGLFLLADRDYFSTPMWESPGEEGLISVKKKPAPKRTSPRPPRGRPRGDTIQLATEAGIDITLYWDGKTYRIHAPDEEP